MSSSSSNPDDPKHPKSSRGEFETPSYAELPDWLKTDDWVQTPASPESGEVPTDINTDDPRQTLSLPPESNEPPTELIEIVEDTGGHPIPSDDSLFINDDVQIISGPSSGVLDHGREASPPEPSEMLLPPIARAEREHLKSTGAGEDDVDISALFGEEPGQGGPSSILRRSRAKGMEDAPAGDTPVSAWFPRSEESTSAAGEPSSKADIDLPPTAGEGASDIFSTAKGNEPGTIGSSNNSALYTGAESNIFIEDRDLNRQAGGESHIMNDPESGGIDGGSSQHDDPGKATDRVTFDLPPVRRGANPSRIGSSAGDLIVIPEDPGATDNKTLDEDRSERSNLGSAGTEDPANSGSNLFGERHLASFEQSGPPSAGSGVNLSDPDAGDAFEAGPLSSIFNIPHSTTDSQDEGRVNIDQIPAMGSSDENTEAMLHFEDDAGPSSSVLSDDGSGTPSDSGMIEWSHPDPSDDATYRAEYQQSMRMRSSDSDVQLPGLDQVSDANLSIPSSSSSSSGSIFGSPSSNKGRALPKLPGVESEPALTLPSSSLLSNVSVPPSHSGRWLVGALGVLVGAGLGVGGMALVGGGGSKESVAPSQAAVNTPVTAASPSGIPATTPPAGGIESAKSLLSSGDVQAALAAFEAAGDSNEAKVGRGQARWMVRVREAAREGAKLNASDPELARAASELQGVMAAMATEAGPEQQLLGAKAALHLGLIREVSGKPDEALVLYADASRKFPAFKRWFESARQRVTVMKKNADGSPVSDFSRLPLSSPLLAPEDADQLAIMSMVLLDFDPVQQTEDEAGYHFWEAIQWSANWNQGRDAFTKAIAAIDRAKKAHDDRRRKLVGMGLNPVSDPREQMFLRACDELKFYWTFKGQIYGDPTGMALARSNKGTSAILADLFAAKKSVDSMQPRLKQADEAIAAAKKAAEELEAVRTKAQNDVAAAEKRADEKASESRKALDALSKREEELQAAMTRAKTQAEAATKSQAELADAQAKLKLAESALDSVISRMKTAKLIDEKASRAEAMAALPEATRKAAIVTTGSKESEELTKQLAEAQKRVQDAETRVAQTQENAKKAKEDLEKQLKSAMAAAEQKTQDLEAKIKSAQGMVTTEVQKAVEKTRGELEKQFAVTRKNLEQERSELQAKIDEARQIAEQDRKALETERAQTAARLATLADQYRSQLAALRAGASNNITLLEADQQSIDRAARNYADGVSAYFEGNYTAAVQRLNSASLDDPTDARVWYFLGLSKLAMGQSSAAEQDFQRGSDLEARGKPGRVEIGIALERVQGGARQKLDQYRP